MGETVTGDEAMFFKVLTLHWRPDNGSVKIEAENIVETLNLSTRERLLDKLHEVLDPDMAPPG